MEKHQDALRLATMVLFCALNIGFGLYARQVPMLISGAAGLVYAAVVTAMGLYHSTETGRVAHLALRSRDDG